MLWSKGKFIFKEPKNSERMLGFDWINFGQSAVNIRLLKQEEPAGCHDSLESAGGAAAATEQHKLN